MLGIKGKNKSGFSLVESLVAVAIFIMMASVVYQTSTLLIKGVGTYREDTTISSLAGQYMEIARNLPYSAIGTLNGNPHGELPDLPNPRQTTINNTAYQIYYVVNYIDDPSDGTALAGTDFAANDYKQIKLYIKNINSAKIYSFLTNITPKGLENMEDGGALFVKVFDAVGQPVPNATINIINTTINPNINLTRMTDASGNWIEVGLPDSANSYHLTVTKNGYSTDSTHTISSSNPNPTKPDSTIANGQITQVSFSIDRLSTLSFSTLNQSCFALSDIGMEIHGEKLIGNPSLLKFDHNYTSNSSGNISLGSIEWDNYTPALTDSSKMIYGSSPIQQVSVLPNTNQNFTLILGPKTDNSLLVIVKDAATGNPIENANILLKNVGLNVDLSAETGGSVWISNNWSGGDGQTNWSDNTRYFSSDGNISANIIPEALRLLSYDNGATYAANGYLVSSIFDTGTASTTYTTINWQPTSENPATSLKFQIATGNDNSTTTWNYIGPDGTSNSYYTTSGTTINSPAARYIRYKTYLGTTDETKTSVLTSVNINYVSGCFTPGQVIFPGLDKASGYELTIGAAGYTTQIISPLTIEGYQTLEILLTN